MIQAKSIKHKAKNKNQKAGLTALCFLLFAFCFSCDAQNKPGWTVTLKGKVNSPQAGQSISIQELKEGGASGGWQDEIKLDANNTYAKKITLTEPGYYRLNFYNKQVLNLIVYKSDLEVNVDGGNPQGFSEVKGSPDMDLINKVQEIQGKTQNAPEIAKLNADFGVAVQNKDQAKIAQLQADYQNIVKKYNDEIAALVVQYSPSLAAINILQNNMLDKEQYYPTFEAVAAKLKKEWPTFSHSKNFIEFVDKLKSTAVGQPAPEIALPNPDGKVVALSSMKGKYVLVDFWAKWCGPCRQENPNVVRVFNKYKDKGFTVFGVSLDRSKEDWVKAISEDGLTWTHVSDLKYWQSEAAKTYSISAIPFSLLIDPNGIIIAKNLRGPALESKLAEIFEKRTN